MRRPSSTLLLLAVAAAMFVILPVGISSAQFTVTESDFDLLDFDMDDGICSICFQTDGDGNCVNAGGCTLAAAIQHANIAPDLSTIEFAVGYVLNPSTPLPAILFPVIINANGGGTVSIIGPGPTPTSPGLVFSGVGADGSEIYNLNISGYPNGIEFRNSSFGIVEGCYIFNNQPSGNGILVSGSSTGVRIGGLTNAPGIAPGNIIAGNGTGIRLTGSGGHLVYGNDIGFDDEGNALGNTTGIVIGIGAGEGTEIGGSDPRLRNVISNSQFDGISISGTGFGVNDPVTGVKIRGNTFGTDRDYMGNHGNLRGITLTRTEEIEIGGFGDNDGNLFLANGDAIWLNNNANNSLVARNTIGYNGILSPVDGNTNGIVIRADANDNLIQSNLIASNSGEGIVVTSVNDLVPSRNMIIKNEIGSVFGDVNPTPNDSTGIRVNDADSTTISENIIAENGGYGIVAIGSKSVGLTISENLVGVPGPFAEDTSGAAGNEFDGILLVSLTGAVVDSNVVANNGANGIRLSGVDSSSISRNEVYSNMENGILIAVESSSNTIGGIEQNSGNQISSNGSAGVRVESGTKNSIRHNIMAYNQGLGIDLGQEGRTEDDAGDADSGPNNLQNAPFLVSITGNNTDSLSISYSVQSATAQSEYPLEIDFFIADVDPGGMNEFGEGLVYIGSHTYEFAQAEQIASVLIDVAATVEDGDFIVATATDANGNTSEFSSSLESIGRAVSVDEPKSDVFTFDLSPGYPNPSSGIVSFNLDVPAPGRVSIEVYNILGKRVAVLLDGLAAPGRAPTVFDGRDLPSGTYFVRASSENRVVTRPVVLVR